jgi:hypothetical protein
MDEEIATHICGLQNGEMFLLCASQEAIRIADGRLLHTSCGKRKSRSRPLILPRNKSISLSLNNSYLIEFPPFDVDDTNSFDTSY